MVKKTMQQNKRGQVTIFIFLAILIVGAILVYIFYLQPNFISQNSANLKIDSCVSDLLEENVKELVKTAGLINPTFTYQYAGKEVPYLCYTNEYYQTCTVQTPFPEKTFEDNLAKLTQEGISFCYSDSLDDLRRKGYEISEKVPDFILELQPEKIITSFDGDVTITKEASQTIGKLEVETPSRIYNQLMIATSILQQEVQFGDSDVTYIMQLYPEYLIDKMKQSDGTTIYTITDKQTKMEYQFASKSLPWPPGYGLNK